jgi:leader peptidase (prepilin peptidase)/N-methyltransferase
MIRALRKTSFRTSRFLVDALAWRAPDRQHAIVAWCLLAGALCLAASLSGVAEWPGLALAGLYLLAVLGAICAIDARYGIIPDSLVGALAMGGVFQIVVLGQAEVSLRSLEAILTFAAACLFRAGYRWFRGHEGLGFGDVKFTTAAMFWVGTEGLPVMLLMSVLSALASLLILRADGFDLHGKQAISFGPHLAVGLWLTWIVGPL